MYTGLLMAPSLGLLQISARTKPGLSGFTCFYLGVIVQLFFQLWVFCWQVVIILWVGYWMGCFGLVMGEVWVSCAYVRGLSVGYSWIKGGLLVDFGQVVNVLQVGSMLWMGCREVVGGLLVGCKQVVNGVGWVVIGFGCECCNRQFTLSKFFKTNSLMGCMLVNQYK